jgi:soluble lytic murein transglycosylase
LSRRRPDGYLNIEETQRRTRAIPVIADATAAYETLIHEIAQYLFHFLRSLRLSMVAPTFPTAWLVMPRGLRFFLCGSLLLASIDAPTQVGAAAQDVFQEFRMSFERDLRRVTRGHLRHHRAEEQPSPKTAPVVAETVVPLPRARPAVPPESAEMRTRMPSASAGIDAAGPPASRSEALPEPPKPSVGVPPHEELIRTSREATLNPPPLTKPLPARTEATVPVGIPPTRVNKIESATDPAAPVGPSSQCPERDFVDDAGALPLPCRSGVSAPGETLLASLSRLSTGLQAALDALGRGDLRTAHLLARRTDLVTEHIVSWMALISGAARLSSSEVDATMQTLQDWPGRSRMRGRYEEALARERPSRSKVLQAFAEAPPSTVAGIILYARVLQASGRAPEARDLIGHYWREHVSAGDGGDQAILSNFASLLSPADHQARVARLLGQGKIGEAERAAALLDKNSQEQVKAWIAMRNGAKGDDDAPVDQPLAPAKLFARVQLLRKTGHGSVAAVLMLCAPSDPSALVDTDGWAAERRLVAHDIAKDSPRIALTLTSSSPGASSSAKTDIEFDAGRYAFRLNRQAEAIRHFQTATSSAGTPEEFSRAHYWLGRVLEAEGLVTEAAEHFRDAGKAPTTFYGQLALTKLGVTELPIPGPSMIDRGIEQRFRARELVQAAARLASIGRRGEAELLYRYLAQSLTDPVEVTLLANMIDDQRDPSFALEIAQVADADEAAAKIIAYPIDGIPLIDREDVELPAIYAIARQESGFRKAVVSPAGAQGLLQLMPPTAEEVADRLGLDYSFDRLTSDAAYNTTLGAAYLGSLLARFNGSYAMSFAAYNAGEGRVEEWVKAYGDPRRSGTDVVDWIESIPIEETHNYVQRTLENLQVYRARLGRPELNLQADLTGYPGHRPDPLATSPRKRAMGPDRPQPAQ